MKTYSRERPEVVQTLGSKRIVNFNVKEVTVTDNEGEESVQYEFNTATFSIYDENILDALKKVVVNEVNKSTSGEILEGFWFQDRHYSYDIFDQTNFSDTFNMVTVLKSVGADVGTLQWNSYVDKDHKQIEVQTLDEEKFIALYTQGALIHKQNVMAKSSAAKEAIKAAKTVEEVVSVTF